MSKFSTYKHRKYWQSMHQGSGSSFLRKTLQAMVEVLTVIETLEQTVQGEYQK
jgi:hypothetical protein